MEWHAAQRNPACTTLPAIIDPPLEEPSTRAPEDESKFDWSDDDCVVLQDQARTAVYLGQSGHLVIRQERQWDQDDDTYVLIAPHNIADFIDRLTDIAGIPSVGK